MEITNRLAFLKREFSSLIIRFIAAGTAVALLYLSLFLTLRDMIFLSVWLSNVTAFSIAVVFQYILQSILTFRKNIYDARQLMRFLVTITLGLIISSLITSFIGPILGFSDLLSAAIVVIVLPVFNFIIFGIWVFVRNERRDCFANN